MINQCYILYFLALILSHKSDAAVNCTTTFTSIGELVDPSATQSVIDGTSALIMVDVSEGAPVDSLLYKVYWSDNVTNISLSGANTNEGMNYMNYEPDFAGNKMDVVVTQSMSRIVDYDNPSRTEQLEIYLDFLFVDETKCLLILHHDITDDNTNAPHFSESSYNIAIREDFPLYLDIPGLNLEAYDYDAKEPRNTFSISLDPGCPLKVSVEGNFTCNMGQPVPINFVLTIALDYDTMPDPQQIVCTATLQDYGTPQLTSSSTIILNVSGYPDEIPQFTSNYYIGTLSSDMAGTVVDVNPPIVALDKDIPPTSVTYTMNTADPSIPGMSYFSINDTTAEVLLIQDLDGEILAYDQVTFFLKASDENEQVGYSVLNVMSQTQLATTATCEPCYSFSTCLPCDCISETSFGSTIPHSSDSPFDSTITKSTDLPLDSTISGSTNSPLDSTISGSTSPSNSDIEFLVNGYVFQVLTSSQDVGQVEAATTDGSPIIYSWINNGSPGLDFFNMGKNTGFITAITNPTPVGNFDLIAVASSDGLRSAETKVTIVVYAPYNSSLVVMQNSIVNVETSENAGPSFLVRLEVAASPGDPVFCIQSVLPSEFTDSFSIDSTTGDLSTTKSLDADDPAMVTLETINILVAAYSSPDILCEPSTSDFSVGSDQTVVYVSVTDQNDNAPSFVPDYELVEGILVFAYPKEVSIQRAIGPIGYVHAVDADVTSTVFYSLASYDSSTFNFAIDQDSGEIYLVGSFDCFVANCSMKVTASDSEHEAELPIKIIGLTKDYIHTMVFDNVDITDVDSILANISGLSGINIHHLYSTVLSISSSKGADKWQIQVQVYAESGGQLMTLDEFNRGLNESGFKTATSFSDSDAFSSTIADNTGYKVAVGILGAALGIILIVGIVILVKRHRKKERLSRFPAKQISTLGKTYAHQMNQTDEKSNGEESFFTIFGNGSIGNKSRISMKSTTSAGSNSTKTSNDTVQNTKTTTIEAYNNYALEDERPYQNGSSSSTITKAEIHSDNSGSLEEKPTIRSYYLEWEKLQESQQQRNNSSDSNNSSAKSETLTPRKSSLDLYPSIVNQSSRNSRHSPSNSSTNSEDSISNIRRASSKELMTEDPERKSVAFKVLLETKEYEPYVEPVPEEKSVAFKVLVETKQIEPDVPESQEIFTIL